MNHTRPSQLASRFLYAQIPSTTSFLLCLIAEWANPLYLQMLLTIIQYALAAEYMQAQSMLGADQNLTKFDQHLSLDYGPMQVYCETT